MFRNFKNGQKSIFQLGKKKIVVNNVLVLEIKKVGLLANKEFYDKNSMQSHDGGIILHFFRFFKYIASHIGTFIGLFTLKGPTSPLTNLVLKTNGLLALIIEPPH